MIKESKNKDMADVQIKENKVTEPLLEEFHFPGGQKYIPMTIKAESYTQALQEYEATKKPVGDTIINNNQ